MPYMFVPGISWAHVRSNGIHPRAVPIRRSFVAQMVEQWSLGTREGELLKVKQCKCRFQRKQGPRLVPSHSLRLLLRTRVARARESKWQLVLRRDFERSRRQRQGTLHQEREFMFVSTTSRLRDLRNLLAICGDSVSVQVDNAPRVPVLNKTLNLVRKSQRKVLKFSVRLQSHCFGCLRWRSLNVFPKKKQQQQTKTLLNQFAH